MKPCYYNDNDPFVCAWLRHLIAAGHLPAGDVDERPIQEVTPDDVRGYSQAHFFAGIGGWPYALALADWGDRPVWTGSCPCQPFSQSGVGAGPNDPRHLWPIWHSLIAECRPATIFGEQVSGPSGRSWFDLVSCDLEDDGYAVAAADLPVACVGAPHLRYRLWWVAAHPDADGVRWEREQPQTHFTTQEDARFQLSEFEGLVSSARELAIPAGRWGAVADGVSGRMGKLRAYGNAIVPQVAAAFVRAYVECGAALAAGGKP